MQHRVVMGSECGHSNKWLHADGTCAMCEQAAFLRELEEAEREQRPTNAPNKDD